MEENDTILLKEVNTSSKEMMKMKVAQNAYLVGIAYDTHVIREGIQQALGSSAVFVRNICRADRLEPFHGLKGYRKLEQEINRTLIHKLLETL